jgi:hypothetical protein
MNITLKILENDKQINQLIFNELSQQISQVFSKSSKLILNKVKELIRSVIISQPEYSALKNGSLRLELGIPDTTVVDSIVSSLLNTTNIELKPIKISGNKLSGGFLITFLDDAQLQSIIDSPDGMVNDAKGYSLPWLKWLLSEGVKPIVKGYSVRIGPNRASRTGMAIMVNSASSWSVPAQFAGNKTNNWITRAIGDIEDNRISSIIQEEVTKNL